VPRLNDALIANERYRGEPSTDEEGRTQWPIHVVWDDELLGFGIRIHPPVRGKPSRKDFIVSWKVGLKSRTMGIGTFGVDCTLRQARKAAREALDLARRGQDPIEARHRALGIGTAEDLASRFLFEHNAAKRKPVPGDPASAAPGAAQGETGVDPAAGPPAVATPGADAGAPDAVAPDPIAAAPADAAASPAPEAAAVTTDSAGADDAPAPAMNVPAPSSALQQAAPSANLDSEPADLADAGDAGGGADDDPDSLAAAEAPAAPPPVSAPRIGEARRAAAPAPKRGPTKVRLLPVPESLYRTIETGARESEMTIAAYLNALIEIARAAVGDEDSGTGGEAAGAADSAPGIKELFERVQEAQAVQVGGSSADDPEHGPRRG
jgi:hypothetical protein